MKKKSETKSSVLAFLFGLSVLLGTTATAQHVPVSSRPDIKITKLLNVPTGCSRLARDPVSGHLFFVNQNGNVYEVLNTNGTYSSVLRATKADHGITLLQGMAFKGKSLFLIGNSNGDSISYVGKIVKGVLQSTGTRIWTPVMTSEKYGYTNTAYNHGFSGITVSPDSAYLFISSGSRTDHGEIQTRPGLKPDLREEPLTSAIFRIPIDSVNLVLPNDSAMLAAKGYLYADGTRNSFDLAFGPDGNLYGCENSGDRDDPEELNWIRQGRFYGFPWRMGGNETPMQFANYDPKKDKLLNPNCNGAIKGFFYNDPTYPKRPNIPFTEPIVNTGPDDDQFRDTTGVIRDGNGLKLKFTTFTPHKSPLGLVFDRDSLLADEFKGHGFVLGWTEGVSTTSKNIGPFLPDPGEDLSHIQFIYDAASDNYKIQTHRIANNFNNPVDAEMVGNIIYVLEYGGSSPKIWKVEMPKATGCGPQHYFTREVYNNITGTTVANLTKNVNYPNKPSSVTKLTSFEAPINTGDNYGARIRGYITAPASGNYTFWIAADNAAELWLSTDSTVGHKRRIALVSAYTASRQYTKYVSQQSAVIALKAGKKYYVEALHKESTGGDNLSVKWKLPNGATETPISCIRLSPYIPPPPVKVADEIKDEIATNPVADPITVFPNPTKGIINVTLMAKNAGTAELVLTDLMGLKVYSSLFQIVNGENLLSLNDRSFNKGIYILHISFGGNNYTRKVIVQ